MLTMNEKDKNEMLEAILNENEAYQCKLWAVIMAGADTYALIGGLSTLTGGAAAALGCTEQCLLLYGNYRETPEYGHCKFRQCLQN